MDPQQKQEAKYKAKSIMGILSDKMDVASAKLRGEEGGQLDVAIIKATLNDEVVPKEKHVRTLKIGSGGSAPRQQVNYIIHGLAKRLEENKNAWLVTLKTLVVFHRLMREVDPSFQEEMLKYSERTGLRRILRLDGFADHTTKETWDLSAWIRVYSVYLDERLEVFRSMRFDPEQDAGGKESSDSKLKTCPTPELLERLPLVQKLLARLVACVPAGAAQNNEIVVQACGMVLREIRSIYKVVCEGIINLADKFFEMERSDALKGLEMYRENMALNEKLNAFFSSINAIGSLRGSVQFPQLQALPADFLGTLEEYVKEAPKQLDPSLSGSGRKGGAAPPPTATRASTIARAGGTTSAAISGSSVTSGLPPAIPAPIQGVLQIGGPIGSPTAPAPAAEVDLLGADLSELTVSPSTQPQQPQQPQTAPWGESAWGAPSPSTTPAGPPAAAPAAGSFGFGDSAFGAPAPAQPQQPFNAFNDQPAFTSSPPQPAPPQQQHFAPFPGAGPMPGQPGVAMSAGSNPFGANNPFAAAAPFNPGFPPGPAAAPAPMAYGAPPAQMAPLPYGSAAAAGPSNPFGGVSASFPPPGGAVPGSNPFGGAAAPPAWGPSPSNTWQPNKDPLGDLSFDVLGKPAGQTTPAPTLRDLKGQGSPNLL